MTPQLLEEKEWAHNKLKNCDFIDFKILYERCQFRLYEYYIASISYMYLSEIYFVQNLSIEFCVRSCK